MLSTQISVEVFFVEFIFKHVNKKHSREYSRVAPVVNHYDLLDDDVHDQDSDIELPYLQLSGEKIEDYSFVNL